jgi:hypothetical protein
VLVLVLVSLRVQREVTRQLAAMSAKKLCVFFCVYNRVCVRGYLLLHVTECCGLFKTISSAIRDWNLFSYLEVKLVTIKMARFVLGTTNYKREQTVLLQEI